MLAHIAWLTDLSSSAARCEGPILALSRLADAEVHIVHALGQHPEGRDRAFAELQGMAQRLSEQGVNARPVVSESTPEAWAHAFSHPRGMLAVGRTGQRGLDRLILGSSTEKILREATQPVLVSGPRKSFDGLQSILCGVDPDHESHAIEAALDLALAAGAPVTFLHAVNVDKVLDDDQVIEDMRALVRSALSPGQAEQLKATFEVGRAAGPAEGIIAVAQKHSLTVVGSKGRRGIARFVLGSVAEQVARAAPTPVLVVPERD
ncbi:MAG: universal stress protein [Myxococcota bacterium]|nr:universal stress protein [Myxococcota bacterium]